MLTLLFLIFIFGIFWFAIKVTWGITKILFSVILLPLVLIGLFFAGLVYIAVPALIIIGVVALLRD